EARFLRTIGAASHRLESLLDVSTASGATTVPGADAFLLYDTYGMPLELTREIATRRGFSIDEPGFHTAMEEQRTRAREHARFFTPEAAGVFASLQDHSAFTGYSHLEADSGIVAIVTNGQLVDLARQGEQCEVVLDTTPFYPEGGGQVGDRGNILGPSGVLVVEDTRATGGAIVHRGVVSEGEIRVADPVVASVDHGWRAGAARNHTGTHLLHASLRAILGSHVRQQGSLVGPERLRFDFTHLEASPREALIEVQALANDRVRADLEVAWRSTSYRQAVESGALAFFGDKYGAEVRVVEIKGDDAPFSAELCGGTHVHHTGELGFVHIVREQAVAAGTRRIEALTGRAAETYLVQQNEVLQRLAGKLSTTPDDLEARIEALQQDLERLRRQNDELERVRNSSFSDALVEAAQLTGDAHLVVARVTASSPESLKDIADRVRQRLDPSLVLLGAEVDGRPAFLVAASPGLVQRGVHAGDLVRAIAAVAGGGGGGRADLAQAGAKDPSRLDAALEEGKRLARAALGA
ncbi:MAG: alanine--tRNA ligase-related protein, partial [Dehalococcoidia bacterium]